MAEMEGLPPEAANPVIQRQRITSIDSLRGVALLGILVINIPFFALSHFGMFDPDAAGDFSGANYLTWLISHLFFDLKMMAIFSMLFGAGIVLMTDRAREKTGRSMGVHYRRMAWLLLIGLIHAYLIWFGDILVLYAMCGMIIYPLRRLPAAALVVVGALTISVGLATNYGQGTFFEAARDAHDRALAKTEAGETPDPFEAQMKIVWPEISEDFNPTPQMLAEEREIMLDGYWGIRKHHAPEVVFWQTYIFLTFGIWRAGGLMLLGMGLYKLGVFSAQRSTALYGAMVVLGYAMGFPLIWIGAQKIVTHDFDFIYFFRYGWNFNYLGSLFVALGHVGLVMLLCRMGALAWLMRALAAVGQMALTNYLMQSIICTLVFYGYGFGLWGSFTRFELIGFVLAVWAVQIIWSPLWLRAFRFGPFEWLWRSLTYWKWQPFRREPPQVPAPT